MPSSFLRNKLIALGHVTANPIAGTSTPFVDPTLVAADPTLQSLQSSNAWPVFNNDAERTIAINNGTFDPSYPSPLQKKLAESISLDRAKTSDSLISTQEQEHPLAGARTPSDILAAQLAGDRDGTIKKIILSSNGLDPQTTGTVPNLKPYIGSVAPNAHGIDTVAPLDFEILHHPDFAKTYAKDPKEGARVYQALTGRSLVDDTASTKKLIEHHQNFRRDTYEKNIANGAKPDPSNPTSWLIRQAPQMDESGTPIIGMSTAPKRSEYRPATESENDIMNSVHSEYSSGRSKSVPTFTPGLQRTAASVLHRASSDPALKKLLIDRKTVKGGDLNPMEILHTGTEYDEQQAAQEALNNPTTLGFSPGPSVTKGLMKFQDFFANIFGGKQTNAPDAPDNAMMEWVKKHGDPVGHEGGDYNY